jgi:O-antigen/teichoic acid export membrane protein
MKDNTKINVEEKEITRYTSIYTTVRYISYIFNGLSGLFIAKILGPSLFGVLSALMLIVLYSNYSHMGLLHAILKKVPFYRGANELNKIEEVKSVGFSVSMLISFSIGIILFISSFFLNNITIETANGLRLISIIVILQQFFQLTISTFRVEKKFIKVSVMNLIYSIVRFLLIILLGRYFKLEGVLLASIIAYSIIVLYVIKYEKLGIKLNLDLKKARSLIKIGFLPLIVGISWVIYTSIDKIMILKYLGKTELGYYSIGILLMELLVYVPQAIGFILMPYFLERYGQAKEIDKLKPYFIQTNIIITHIMPIIIGAVILIMPMLINHILPDYQKSLFVIPTLIITVFFSTLTSITNVFLISIDKEKDIIIYQVMTIAIAIGLNWLFISKGYGIYGVAIATLVTYMLFSYILNILTLKFLNYTTKEKFSYFLKSHLPFIYILGILIIIPKTQITLDIGKDIISTIIQMSIFAIASSPIIYYLNKKTDLIRLIINYLKGIKNNKRI